MVSYRQGEVNAKLVGVAISISLLMTTFVSSIFLKLSLLCFLPWLFFIWFDLSRPEGVATFFSTCIAFLIQCFFFWLMKAII